MISQYTEELAALIKDAKRRAADTGHSLIVWRGEGTAGELRCEKCHGMVGVAVYPPPGGDKISGKPLTEKCR